MKMLYKSVTNRKIAGVCGGIGEYLNVDPTIVRLAFVVLAFFTCGTAALIYLIAMMIMPG